MHIPDKIRKLIIAMSYASKEGHVPSSFSVVEILCAINKYWQFDGEDNILKILDHLVLSKGHSVFALYAFAKEYGYLDINIEEVCAEGGRLIGHVPHIPEKGFSFGTGSLGHGLPYAAGRAYKLNNKKFSAPIFCIVGDGELNEGSCYETFLILNKFKDIGLKILIDYNNSSERGLPVDSFVLSLKSNWAAQEVDGHSIEEICKTLSSVAKYQNHIIICKTIKGFPIEQMVDNPLWHHKSPTQDELVYFTEFLEGKHQ
jgi:transketolase